MQKAHSMKSWTGNAYLKEKVAGSLCKVLIKHSRERP